MAERAGPILYLDGISVSFEGLKALNGLSWIVERGELRTIIGPNGAGKTTVMDVVTGKTRPDGGTALFNGRHDLTRLDEATIANLGIGRRFQKPTVIESLTVLENLELALKGAWRLREALFFRLSSEAGARVASTIQLIGLAGRDDAQAGALSHGQKQ